MGRLKKGKKCLGKKRVSFRSRFDRKQRVTLCMAMLYLFILCSAIFYQQEEGRITDPYFQAGPIGFDPIDVSAISQSLREPIKLILLLKVGMGFIFNLVVFPPVLLAAFFFRRAKPFGSRTNRIDLGLAMGKSNERFG